MSADKTRPGAPGDGRSRRPVPPPVAPGLEPGGAARRPIPWAPPSPPATPPPRPAGYRPPDDPPPTGPGGPGRHDPLGPETRGPLRRHAAWGWGSGLAGLAVGFGPEMLLYAASLGAVAADTADTEVTTTSAIALVVISLLVYVWQIAAAWFFSVRTAGAGLAAWGFRLPTRAYFWTIPAALAVVYVVSIAHDVLVDPKRQDIVGEFPHTTVGIVLFVLLAVIIAPLFEEIFFRGFLFRAFASSWGWVAGAAVSSAVFGIAHLQLDVFLPLFALGLMLAWVYQRTGSLWTSISLHALFNGLSVLVWALGG